MSIQARFDISHLEIGPLEFCDKPRQISDYLVIGKEDSLSLAIETKSGEAVLYNEPLGQSVSSRARSSG